MIRNLIVIVTLLLVAMLPFVTSEHKEELPSGIKILRNIQYVENSTNPRQSLDLFLPRTSKDKMLPLVVWIHGGGWMEGAKSDSPALELARKGFATCAINYRLAPKNIFPAQIHDCKAAIRWLRKNAKEYRIDENRIGVWGLSAGGHLAALLATTGKKKLLEGNLGNEDISSEINACCDWCGPADLVNFKSQCPPESSSSTISPPDLVDLLLGGPVNENLELAKEASPITYASGDCAPILIMHAKNDPIVPFIQSQEFANRLVQVNAPSKLIKVNSDEHVFLTPGTLDQVINFFTEKLIDTKPGKISYVSKSLVLQEHH